MGSRVLDPRTKLLLVWTGSIIVLLVPPAGLVLLVGGAAITLLVLHMPKQALTGVSFFAVLLLAQYGISQIPLGPVLMSGFMLYFIAQITPVAMLSQGLLATPPGDLMAALQRMWVPRTAVLACAVALRFIPTIGEELRTVRDGMRQRGIRVFALRSLSHPILTAEAFYVPLLSRSMRVADELSVSATCRGADSPGRRTTLRELRATGADAVAIVSAAAALTAALASKIMLSGAPG